MAAARGHRRDIAPSRKCHIGKSRTAIRSASKITSYVLYLAIRFFCYLGRTRDSNTNTGRPCSDRRNSSDAGQLDSNIPTPPKLLIFPILTLDHLFTPNYTRKSCLGYSFFVSREDQIMSLRPVSEFESKAVIEGRLGCRWCDASPLVARIRAGGESAADTVFGQASPTRGSQTGSRRLLWQVVRDHDEPVSATAAQASSQDQGLGLRRELSRPHD